MITWSLVKSSELASRSIMSLGGSRSVALNTVSKIANSTLSNSFLLLFPGTVSWLSCYWHCHHRELHDAFDISEWYLFNLFKYQFSLARSWTSVPFVPLHFAGRDSSLMKFSHQWSCSSVILCKLDLNLDLRSSREVVSFPPSDGCTRFGIPSGRVGRRMVGASSGFHTLSCAQFLYSILAFLFSPRKNLNVWG